MSISRERRTSFSRSTSGLSSTEFALACALLAIVAALTVREVGGAMSDSMYQMADNVTGGEDPIPNEGGGDDPAPSGGDNNNGAPNDPSGDNDPAAGDQNAGDNSTPAPAPAPDPNANNGGKKKKKKKKKKK